MIVKKNQAALYDYLDLLFTLPAHPADQEVWQTVGPTTEKGHGRLETRTLTCGNAHIEDVDWPDVQQVVRRTCERIILTTGKRTREVTYGLVSMTPAAAGAATIAALWRGHWTIENRLHDVRNVSIGEDADHAARGTTTPARCGAQWPAHLVSVRPLADGSRCPRALRCLRSPCSCPHWPTS